MLWKMPTKTSALGKYHSWRHSWCGTSFFLSSSTHDATNMISSEDEYYSLGIDEAYKYSNSEGNKMILLEPRAYSESVQISDYLKMRNSVVVNLQRVTSDQGKRIVDFLSGTIYAIGGDMQKIGNGIFLCTPRNMNVEGKITEDKDTNKDEIDTEW